jgi:hypothetical protein
MRFALVCTEDEIVFTLKDLTKSRRVGQSPVSVKFRKYTEQSKLDIVSCTLEYLVKTKIIRAGETQLFVIFIKPHIGIKSCIIAKWLKHILALSGINVSVFKSHSTRGARISKANKYGLFITFSTVKYCNLSFESNRYLHMLLFSQSKQQKCYCHSENNKTDCDVMFY